MLGGIFAGEIRYWDDPLIVQDNPELELPHRSIAVVGRRASSGTTFAFTSYLAEISDVWRISGRGADMRIDRPGGAMTAPGHDGVAGRIAISEDSIGYVEFSFARRLELPVALIQNRVGNFVRPALSAGSAALAESAAAEPSFFSVAPPRSGLPSSRTTFARPSTDSTTDPARALPHFPTGMIAISRARRGRSLPEYV